MPTLYIIELISRRATIKIVYLYTHNGDLGQCLSIKVALLGIVL